MANELTMFKQGGALGPSKVFEKSKVDANALDAGVGVGFGKVTSKGGKWGIRYQGETRMLRRTNAQGQDDGPSPFLDVVIINAAERPSKAWYEGKYTEGDSGQPDCASGNGIVPDPGSPKKQSETCALCPQNAWGSAVRGDGTASKGKACADHKRLVVVPVHDIENKVYGGPMLLQVAPTSLKKLGPYKRMLSEAGFPFYGVWTRISFDEQAAFPLFEFDAIRQLTDDEAAKVLLVQDDPLVERILGAEVTGEDIDRADIPQTATTTPAPMPKPVPAPVVVPTPAVSPPLAVAAPAPVKSQDEIDREELAAFRAAKAAAGNGHANGATSEVKKRKPRKPRTPPVSPQPTDSTAVSAKPSEPTIPPAPTPAASVTGGGNAAADAEAGAKIGALIDSLL